MSTAALSEQLHAFVLSISGGLILVALYKTLVGDRPAAVAIHG